MIAFSLVSFRSRFLSVAALLVAATCLLLGTGSTLAQSQTQPANAEIPAVEITFEKQASGVEASLRGLSVVSQQVVWASGAGGTILRTVDGGQTWWRYQIPGRTEVDFRDIHAFDSQHAMVMVAGQPAEFWETRDGGETWSVLLSDPRAAAFFDGFVISNDRSGMGFGDVIAGVMPIVKFTADGASLLPPAECPSLPDTVHGYAASGTSICGLDDGDFLIGTGGQWPPTAGQNPGQSLVLHFNTRDRRWSRWLCPLDAGETSGIFSLASHGGSVVAVGGDYRLPESGEHTAAWSVDRGQTWTAATTPPAGFRSAVAAVPFAAGAATPDQTLPIAGPLVWMCVGTNGADYSQDQGKTWQACGKQNLHTLQFTGLDPAAAAADPKQTLAVNPAETRIGWSTGPGGAIYRVRMTLQFSGDK